MKTIAGAVTGIHAHLHALRASDGALIPVQVELDAGTSGTFRVLGKVSPEAPWRELKAAATAGFIESMSFVPYIALEITVITGGGSVRLWAWEGR